MINFILDLWCALFHRNPAWIEKHGPGFYLCRCGTLRFK